MVAVDIFRVTGGKVVEHWDVMQEEVPTADTASGHAMFTTPAVSEEASASELHRAKASGTSSQR